MLDAMANDGWSVTPDFVSLADSLRLQVECQVSFERGEFHRAGVGKGESFSVRDELRRDHVMWMVDSGSSPEQKLWMKKLEMLRVALNQQFFLGLFAYDGHFAIYPQGGFYQAHLDRHAGTNDRIVTVILYLNDDWQSGDGGELKLWTTVGEKTGAFQLIEPRMGTMVCFFAGDYWHEVLPANKLRMSITGWFRQS